MSTFSVKDFWYELPADRIAKFPLARRDASKLLVYRNQDITHHQFTDLPALLPPDCLLVFNNTKVIPARLYFRKETGAIIEVFLLEPLLPTSTVALAMTTSSPVQWRCAIGNLKRWKNEVLTLSLDHITLKASLVDREKGIVGFHWTPEHLSFSEVITSMGEIPLPPYLNRKAQEADKETYQTVYSKEAGAVAAPTAGLHFTDTVLAELANRKISKDFLTLHVSAGTFQPIKTENVLHHTMHAEQMIVTRDNVENLLRHQSIIAVGTTALRTLESLYWFGVKLLTHPEVIQFEVGQEDAYTSPQQVSRKEALAAVLHFMRAQNRSSLAGNTSIYIRPGYQFRMMEGIITNFHQPGSTLIVLIAALVGDRWRAIYQEALSNNYRFLSYGDSSLLIP